MPWSLVSYEINSHQCVLLSMIGCCCLREKSDFLCQTPTISSLCLPLLRSSLISARPYYIPMAHKTPQHFLCTFLEFYEFPSVCRVFSAVLPYFITARCSVRSHDVGFFNARKFTHVCSKHCQNCNCYVITLILCS